MNGEAVPSNAAAQLPAPTNSGWCLPELDLSLIATMSAEVCYSWLSVFERAYQQRIPPGTDVLQVDSLRDLVQQIGVSPSLKKAWDHQQRKREIDNRLSYREIEITGLRLRDITGRALSALAHANEQRPFLFVRGGTLVRIGEDENGRAVVMPVTAPALKGILERHADFFNVSRRGERKEIDPPRKVVDDILSLPVLPFPALVAVTSTPIVSIDGSILTDPGYDRATRLFYSPMAGTVLPPIAKKPTADDVKEAFKTISDHFGDFPFANDGSSSVNLYATLLTAVLRPLITGPVPLALVDKPAPGTGASLLTSIIAVIALGTDAAVTPAPTEEAEWRKALTAIVLRGNNLVLLDNIEHKLGSASLAAALTAQVWEDRVLGKSEMVTLPIRLTWIGNGNNIVLGGDLPRRCYWCRLDAKSARPWQRKVEYKHPDILSYTFLHRGELLAAILTMARGWINAGCPDPDVTVPKLGGFDEWRRIVGGILCYAGATGFLGNLDTLYEAMDVDGHQWDAFIQRWYDIWMEERVTVAKIVERLKDENNSANPLSSDPNKLSDALPDDLTDAVSSKGSPNRRIGKALSKRKDRIFTSGYQLVTDGDKKNAMLWKVKKATEVSNSQNYPDNKQRSGDSNNYSSNKKDCGEFGEFNGGGKSESFEKTKAPEKNQYRYGPATNSPNSSNSPTQSVPMTIPRTSDEAEKLVLSVGRNWSLLTPDQQVAARRLWKHDPDSGPITYQEALALWSLPAGIDPGRFTSGRQYTSRCIVPGCDNAVMHAMDGINPVHLCDPHFNKLKRLYEKQGVRK